MDLSSSTIVQRIFTCYHAQIKSGLLPVKHHKAVDAIVACRTLDLGASVYRCESERTITSICHSCRHRSCSLCAGRQQQQWLEKQKKRLLSCPHFHTVFTLPHEYLRLWQYNQRWFVSTFFKVVRSTLIDLMEARHGVLPGILMAMHTWGRQLSLHPHIHCVITGGGLNAQRRWQATGEYLLPVKQVKVRYRRRFQNEIKHALASGDLTLPPDNTVHDVRRSIRLTETKEWSVRIEEQYAHGRGVLNYLSRYLKGSAIKPSQIVRCDSEVIGFRYLHHRDKRMKVLSLKPLEFIRRILLHVPEDNQHMVRHYGLYSSAGRSKRNHCRSLIGGLMETVDVTERHDARGGLMCSRCGAPLRLLWTIEKKRKKGNSFIKTSASPVVQQDDETDIAEAKKRSLRMRL